MVKEKHFMEKVHRNVVVARNVARNVVIFGVDYTHYLKLIIEKITF